MTVEPLAQHKCVEIKRIYDRHSVKIVETSFYIRLYREEIVVGEERYPIKDVFDISFYPKNKPVHKVGFLYLHTSRGVRTYYVKEKPLDFIRVFKQRVAGRADG